MKTAQVNTLNVYDILGADKFIVVKDAVAKIRRCMHNAAQDIIIRPIITEKTMDATARRSTPSR